MKKLKLKLNGIKEMLTKEQMKKINGGYGSSSDCVSEVVNSVTVTCCNGKKVCHYNTGGVHFTDCC